MKQLVSQRVRVLPLSALGRILSLGVLLALAGCQSAPVAKKESGGGFFGGDRPPDSVPVDMESIPNAVPVALPLSKTGNKPYTVFGRTWYPLASAKGYRERGVASWYGKKFHGRRTSSGESYDMFAMTAAHPVLPLPSFVKVTNLDNDRNVIVKVNDRGPFLHGRLIDLSYAAAWKLGITKSGTGRVEVEAIDPSDPPVLSDSGASPPKVWTGVVGTTVTDAPVEEPQAEEPQAEEPQAEAAGTFVVQVASFRVLDNALDLRNQLREVGYTLVPKSDSAFTQQRPPYQVFVGPYTDWDSADRARTEQERMTGLRGLVRETPSD